MTFKSLILKFGFRALVGVCEDKGWRIPTKDELGSVPASSEHKIVWVADVPPLKEDRENHAMVLDTTTGKMEVCNKNFMHHVVVIVEKG